MSSAAATTMGNGQPFRWASLLGVAVALFLFAGAANALPALFVPFSLHARGYDAMGGLVWGMNADSAFLGRPFAQIGQEDPAMGKYLVTFMDTMCAFMMGYALLLLGVVWFGLRRGSRWALWTSAVGGFAPFVYYAMIAQTFLNAGVTLETILSDVGVLAILSGLATVIVVATVLGWLGLRPVRAA